LPSATALRFFQLRLKERLCFSGCSGEDGA
jgi:hypothetical protein